MSSIVKSSTPYLGIFNVGDSAETIDRFAAQTGKSVPIIHTHTDWAQRNPDGSLTLRSFTDVDPGIGSSVTELAQELAQKGAVLAVSWDPIVIDGTLGDEDIIEQEPMIAMDTILSGAHDDYIRQVARQVADLDVPVMMNIFGEANVAELLGYGADGTNYRGFELDQTGQYGDPDVLDGAERVRDVFRHVIDIFNEEGADNVTWFMYMATGYGSEAESVPLEAIYPGDQYIDWVGQSVIIDQASDLGASLDAGYAAWGAITDNPFFIPEMVNMAGGGAEMAAILNALSGYERLGAVTWADFDGVNQHYGFPRIGDSPGEWQALANANGFADMALIDGPNGVVDFNTWREQTGHSAQDHYFYGTAGEDYLFGDSLTDTLIGRGGNDYYTVDSTQDVVVEAAQNGIDTVMSSVDYRLPDHVENLELSGTRNLRGDGNSLANSIGGNGGNNKIYGYAGKDVLSGAAGHDTLQGGDGADTLTGGSGNDRLSGSKGNDVVAGGDGDDRIYGGGGSDRVNGEAGQDTLYLGGGNDVGSGGAEDDRIEGRNGNDVLFGDAGNDHLIGGNGSDTLQGGTGNDTLTGGNGADTLIGGDGNDRLVLDSGADYALGGNGADMFVFGQTGQLAAIGDFDADQDRLDLSAHGLGNMAAFRAATTDIWNGVEIRIGDHVLTVNGASEADFTQDMLLL